MRDKGVHPGLFDRHFRDSERGKRGAFMKKDGMNKREFHHRMNVVARVEGKKAFRKALDAVDAMQESRPLKPPGR